MITRLCAPNPSPLTLDGTNGYIVPVGPGALVAIDPGIDDPAHIGAFLAVAQRQQARFAAVFVTHGHPDHYPGALALRRATGAPIFAHRSATFEHERAIDDGARLTFEDVTFVALHTPGHAPDHLVFWLENELALFTGDVVIGTGTVVIAPPLGDMRHYQASLERLLRDYGHAETIYGGHGPHIRAPRAKLKEYIEHRKLRETQIIAALERAPATITALAGELYASLSAALLPAAARQILAYLIALEREGRVVSAPINREPTIAQAALLHPDLRPTVNMTSATVSAELGLNGTTQPHLLYSLVT